MPNRDRTNQSCTSRMRRSFLFNVSFARMLKSILCKVVHLLSRCCPTLRKSRADVSEFGVAGVHSYGRLLHEVAYTTTETMATTHQLSIRLNGRSVFLKVNSSVCPCNQNEKRHCNRLLHLSDRNLFGTVKPNRLAENNATAILLRTELVLDEDSRTQPKSFQSLFDVFRCGDNKNEAAAQVSVSKWKPSTNVLWAFRSWRRSRWKTWRPRRPRRRLDSDSTLVSDRPCNTGARDAKVVPKNEALSQLRKIEASFRFEKPVLVVVLMHHRIVDIGLRFRMTSILQTLRHTPRQPSGRKPLSVRTISLWIVD